MYFVKPILDRCKKICCRLSKCWRGAVAITFTVAVLPMLLFTGCVIDYNRARTERNRMRSVVDAVLLNAAQDMHDINNQQLSDKILAQIEALAGSQHSYTVVKPIKIDRPNHKISVKLRGEVESRIAYLCGKQVLGYDFTTEVSSPPEVEKADEIYFLLDDSSSMLFVDDKDGGALFESKSTEVGNRRCSFACHHIEDTGKSLRDLAHELGTKLRIDTLGEAVEEVLNTLATFQDANIKLGIYYFAESVYMSNHPSTKAGTYAPGRSMTNLPKRPSVIDLNTLSQELSGYENMRVRRQTNLKSVMEQMEEFIGDGGDGTANSEPRKLLLMVTDGVNGHRGNIPYDNVPMHPSWCQGLKDNGVTIALLYTGYPYLPYDQFYWQGIGRAMSLIVRDEASWQNDTLPQNELSISGREYLDIALPKCASEGLYLRADDSVAIRTAIAQLLTTWLEKLRLTK